MLLLRSLFVICFLVCVDVSFMIGCNAQTWDTGSADTPCVTPASASGSCKALVECPQLYDLIKSRPIPVEVSTLLRSSQCGFINKQPKVCCALDGSSGYVESEIDDTPEESPTVPPQNYLIPNTSVCGEGIRNKLFGGNQTEIGEFPWMTLLEYTKPSGKGFHCGGVLISSRYVLTAAHCVNGKGIPPTWSLTGVRLGEWNKQTDPDCSQGNEECADPPLDVAIESTVVHSQYGTGNNSKLNDIALLRLAAPITFTDWIKPVCLPIYNQDLLNKNFANEDLYVAGWGATELKSESDVLLKIRIPVVPLSTCAPVYASAGIAIGPNQLCAGGQKGKDSCRGDSGGPIMFENLQDGLVNWYVAGITNVGATPCGMQGWPGVYTKVGSFAKWIAANVRV